MSGIIPDVSAALSDGLVAFVKSTCPTCRVIVPVLADLQRRGDLTVYSQDDPSFPPGLAVADERDLERSWRLDLTAVPALLRVRDGAVADRVEGWSRDRWEEVAGVDGLGAGLPPFKPG
jgi:thiol-disulfide isomerase/thioredoxin